MPSWVLQFPCGCVGEHALQWDLWLKQAWVQQNQLPTHLRKAARPMKLWQAASHCSKDLVFQAGLYSSCCGFVTLCPIQIDENNKHKALDSHGLSDCSGSRQSTKGVFWLLCGCRHYSDILTLLCSAGEKWQWHISIRRAVISDGVAFLVECPQQGLCILSFSSLVKEGPSELPSSPVWRDAEAFGGSAEAMCWPCPITE